MSRIGSWAKRGAMIGSAIPGIGTLGGAAIGGGLGWAANQLPGGASGGYKTFGLTEPQIGAELAAARERDAGGLRDLYAQGQRRAMSSAAGRGFATSGAVPMGAPSLWKAARQHQLEREAMLMRMANQMRNSRVHQYQPGLFEQLIPGAAQAGAAALPLLV